IRDPLVTGVQTCALPIFLFLLSFSRPPGGMAKLRRRSALFSSKKQSFNPRQDPNNLVNTCSRILSGSVSAVAAGPTPTGSGPSRSEERRVGEECVFWGGW